MLVFIYHWFVDDEFNRESEKELAIRAYGINEKHETILLHIKNFQPWIYLEMKRDDKTCDDWLQSKVFIKNKITDRCKHLAKNTFYVVNKKKLYFDDQKEYPFFKIRFTTAQVRKNAFYSLQNYNVRSMGKHFVLNCHEHEATPLLQLIVSKNLPTAGWIEFRGYPTPHEEKIASGAQEYSVDYDSLYPVAPEKEMSLGVPTPTVMSFDIEVYSSNPQRMPLAEKEADVIFQISCVLNEQKYLLTLCHVSAPIVGADVISREFATEKDLLLGFTCLVRETNPHIIVGYNIFGFDIPYMIARCKMYSILQDFDLLGIPDYKHAPEKEIKWSSTAYSYQEFHYLDSEGRVFVDLLPVVKRDYKFSNYKLKTVATFFLGETKDPLTPQDIFKAYESGVGGEIKKLSQCGKYCVQDSALVLKLFNVLQLWIGLSEMAKICNVPMMFLFTKGQQIKVYSQVYKKCYYDNILVQSMAANETLEKCQGYAGAFVFPPEPGIYDWVIPFDFSSLYPTTIIAYNIDYSTLVLDESTVDLNDCHVIEWEDHINCEHDSATKKSSSAAVKKLCGKNRFVFKKSPPGVIPSLLMNLLQQRSETKKQMKVLHKTLTAEALETRMTVLDKRQLAYKLSANSMYGAMGVRKGYLPFMPGAMSTTAMGRQSIQKAAEFVKKKHSGHLIYGDSVASDTPLSIKSMDTVRVVTIEKLFQSCGDLPVGYPEFKPLEDLAEKERVEPQQPLFIMSKSGWSPIKKVIRHLTNKKMYRVLTTTGIVDVTEDHSLLDNKGNMVKPGQAKKDDLLLNASMDSFWKDCNMEFMKRIMGSVEILSDGAVVYKKTWHQHKDEAHNLYLYLSQKFPNTRINIQDSFIIFKPYNECIDPPGKILSIQELDSNAGHVYDIETEDGSFHAGIGNLILKNTDSIYCHFPGYTDSKKSWEMAKKVEDQLIQLFPSPMKLVFEEKIYKKFLILTKKRYMAYTCGEEGVLDEKLTIRGVLLARRDNCKWIRTLYEKVVRSMMDGATKNEVYDTINHYVLDLMRWKTTKLANFIVSKQVNKDYKIKALPTDYKKFKKRLEDLGVYDYPSEEGAQIESVNKKLDSESFIESQSWLSKYVLKTKPAHIQLAMKMTRRGKPVEAGSRIEYIIIEHQNNPKAKLYDKLEDPAYFTSHRDLLRMDRLYYLRSLAEPMDQLLNVVFKHKNFVSKLYDAHLQNYKIVHQIRQKTAPIILIGDEVYKPPKPKKKPSVKKNSLAVVGAVGPKNLPTLYDFI